MTTELTKAAQQACHCQTCRPITMEDMRMVLCPTCGNKRCPHANDHRNACTGSNEPGQPGSAYPASALTTSQPAQATPSSANRTLCDYFLNPNLSPVLSFDDDKQATPEPVGEPVAWRWMPSHVFPTWVYSDDQNRVADARRFMGDGGVQALHTHPAPGVPEDVLAVLQAIHRRPSDAGIWLDDLTRIIRAAAQAKGGEHG